MSFAGSQGHQPSTVRPPWVAVGSCDVLLENMMFLVDNLLSH